jgi:L-alanine-DL-glutamate epimerase-like enolase superfamily enzyme
MIDTIDEEGRVMIPDGPGLGVEYDWAFIEDNATGTRTYE